MPIFIDTDSLLSCNLPSTAALLSNFSWKWRDIKIPTIINRSNASRGTETMIMVVIMLKHTNNEIIGVMNVLSN